MLQPFNILALFPLLRLKKRFEEKFHVRNVCGKDLAFGFGVAFRLLLDFFITLLRWIAILFDDISIWGIDTRVKTLLSFKFAAISWPFHDRWAVSNPPTAHLGNLNSPMTHKLRPSDGVCHFVISFVWRFLYALSCPPIN